MTDDGHTDAAPDAPHPNTVPCADCGHVWFEGERPHSYAEDARVICTLCRHQRALGRGER